MNSTKTYIGALLVAIAAIMFWMLALPAYDNISNLRAALADRNTILDNRTAIVNNIKSLGEQYTAHTADIQRFSNLVPADKDTADLISTIQTMASQNGLTLTGLSLSGAGPDQTKNPYVTQPVDISLSGTYLSFRPFLSDLESNLRIIDITNLDINQAAENSTNLSFTIKANAYYLK